MEKKEYKQPEVKVVEIEERILDYTSQEDNLDADSKQGSLDFDTED